MTTDDTAPANTVKQDDPSNAPINFVLTIPIEYDVTQTHYTSGQVAALLGITPNMLRAWKSKGQFPDADAHLNGKTPLWRITTLMNYNLNAPGGRLPYTVV